MHNLYRHLAACDLAVVPRRSHDGDGANRAEAAVPDSPPERIAAAIAEEIGSEVEYRDVESNGAARAARRLVELL